MNIKSENITKRIKYMGNINYRDGKWYIDNIDEIKENDKVEIKENGDLWRKITIGKDHSGLYHESPVGIVLSTDMTIRRCF